MVKSPTTIFGKRLRAARERAGLPQDKLGIRIGLDEGTASARISRYETGIHEPGYDIAAKLAKALKIPAAYLYCADDELAAVILSWPALTKAEKERIVSLCQH